MNKNLLWIFALTGMLFGGIILTAAMTITVSSEAEAATKIGNSVSLVSGTCKVLKYGIEKQITSLLEISEKQYDVQYEFRYTKDGELNRKVETIQTVAIDDITIKTMVSKECDKIWADLIANNKTIDKVIIKPDTTSITSQIYDVIKKTWATETTRG